MMMMVMTAISSMSVKAARPLRELVFIILDFLW
jgi:hypothetical protein